MLSANAASITATNLSPVGGLDFTAFVGTDGLELATGVVSLGTFSSDPADVASVLSTFSQIGPSFTFNTINFSSTVNTTNPLVLGDAFVNSTVYAVVGDGTTLANSTALAVWKATSNAAGNVYTADNPVGGPDLVTVLDSKGDLVIGTRLPSFTTAAGNQAAYQLEAVPEPSALLLSAFGALAVLRRKR